VHPLLAPLLATAAPIALVNARVHPVTSPPVDGCTMVIDGGRILAIGPDVVVPPDAAVVDLTGRVVVPGLIDLHSHVGGGRLHESLGPVQPAISAIDAIDPFHPSLDRARAGGITTVNVMPGSGKLMGGQTAYLSLRHSPTVDGMLVCLAADAGDAEIEGPLRRTSVCGGTKMANGTNPQGSGGDPASRMGSAFLQRQALLRGQAWLDAQEAHDARRGRKRPAAPEPDPEAEALAELAAGQRTVHFHSHRADDVVTAIRLKQEFGIDLVVHHGSEGFKVASLIAEADVPVAINVLDTPGGKEETLERRLDNPAILHAAGVRIALITDDPVQDSRLFLRTGGLAVRGGLAPEAALRAMTLTPAELMGVADRVGSLEVGKQADLVVLSGPPFSVWSQVEQTWVAGEVVFDRSDSAQTRFATGGDAAP
jgi:imidazolonepropionase-like amidohydrolase